MNEEDYFTDKYGHQNIPDLIGHKSIYEAFLEKRLNYRQAFFLQVVHSLCKNKNHVCIASNKWFADKFNSTERSIRGWVSELVEMNFIQIVKFDGRVRHMRVLYDCHLGEQYTEKRKPLKKKHGKQRGKKLPCREEKNFHAERKNFSSRLYTSYKVDIKSTVGNGIPNNGGEIFKDRKNGKSPYKEICLKLHKTVKQKGLLRRSIKIESWIDEIRKLHKLDEVPIEEIEFVMDWYVKNLTGKYIPKAYSTKAFREKFDGIVNAMNQDGVYFSKETIDPDLLEEVTDRLSRLNVSDPLKVARKSLKAVYDFKDFLKRISDRYKLHELAGKENVATKEGCFSIIWEHVSYMFLDEVNLIEVIIKRRRKWNGDISLTSKDLEDEARKTFTLTGYTQDLNKFFEELYES